MVIMGSGLQALFTVTVTLFICQENQYLTTVQHLQTTKCMVHHGILSIISNDKSSTTRHTKVNFSLHTYFITILILYTYYYTIRAATGP